MTLSCEAGLLGQTVGLQTKKISRMKKNSEFYQLTYIYIYILYLKCYLNDSQWHLQWASQQVSNDHQVKVSLQSQLMDVPLMLKPEG